MTYETRTMSILVIPEGEPSYSEQGTEVRIATEAGGRICRGRADWLLGHRNAEMVLRVYGRWISEGEALGFDRPPRRYGMAPLWGETKSISKSA